MKQEIIVSTSSNGSLVIGDECDADVSRTPLEKYRLIVALPWYQSLLASNSTAVTALA